VKIGKLSDELKELYIEIAWDEETHVVILTGLEERSLANGTNLMESILRGNEEPQTKFWSLSEPIAKLDKPVIAAINGDAIRQGLEIALACDIRITTESSQFGLPHIRGGLIPWDGGTQRLSRLVGRG
jgi:enoyl-CoA hydratase/carnithine racemase